MTVTQSSFLAQRWYTTVETAELLRVNKQTVQRWIKAGKLDAIKMTGRIGYRVSEEAIERFLAAASTDSPG